MRWLHGCPARPQLELTLVSLRMKLSRFNNVTLCASCEFMPGHSPTCVSRDRKGPKERSKARVIASTRSVHGIGNRSSCKSMGER
jgi:hypothetical protein